MTGRPATRISGLGVVCVCGRRRVPFPARGIIAFMRIGVMGSRTTLLGTLSRHYGTLAGSPGQDIDPVITPLHPSGNVILDRLGG